jgi:hypothetical protein
MFHTALLSGGWLLFVAVSLHIFCKVALNNFLKVILISSDMMTVEYHNRLPMMGVGYYCFRAGGKREGFRILGVAAQLLSAVCFLGIYIVLTSHSRPRASAAALLVTVFFVWKTLTAWRKIKRLLDQKDLLELDIRAKYDQGQTEHEVFAEIYRLRTKREEEERVRNSCFRM